MMAKIEEDDSRLQAKKLEQLPDKPV